MGILCVGRNVDHRAAQTPVERGKYLVNLGGCVDCHTPGYFFGKPDPARLLGGSEVGFEIAGLGFFYGPNLTPDPGTGLGRWTDEQIVAAFTTGIRPDGRILAPIMRWRAFSSLTRSDALAIVSFLKSLPPVRNKVPGPLGATEKPTSQLTDLIVLLPWRGLPGHRLYPRFTGPASVLAFPEMGRPWVGRSVNAAQTAPANARAVASSIAR